MRNWWQLFRKRPVERVCEVCQRVTSTVEPEPCGTLKVEHQDFGDGSWVNWESWIPCSTARPGGKLSANELARVNALPECGDLDDVMSEIAENGGYYGVPVGVHTAPDPED